MVYPQPPFQFQLGSDILQDSCYSDPATLDMGGLCVGVSSTDVLFHLSARTMFRGSVALDELGEEGREGGGGGNKRYRCGV